MPPLPRISGKCCSWTEEEYDDDDTIFPSLQETEQICNKKLFFPKPRLRTEFSNIEGIFQYSRQAHFNRNILHFLAATFKKLKTHK